MSRIISLLFLLSILYITAGTATARPGGTSASNFIKSSCKSTTYPAICVQSLSAYATAIQQSPRQLALTSLSVSLTRAESTKSFVSKMLKFKNLKHREYEAIKDCIDEMGDTVDRLTKSVSELKHMGGKVKKEEFIWHMSNVETWVSAALTDENTCTDGFQGLNGKVKSSINAQVVSLAQITSNTLSFVNQYAATNY